jgi:hypothetical protein
MKTAGTITTSTRRRKPDISEASLALYGSPSSPPVVQGSRLLTRDWHQLTAFFNNISFSCICRADAP